MKHQLSHKKAIAVNCDKNYPSKYYLRYSDDFILIADNADCLRLLIPQINNFLKSELKLTLHPNKITINKLRRGIDFLGYVILPHYIILRTKTKKRMLKRVSDKNLASYLGLLKHCSGYKIIKMIEKITQIRYDNMCKSVKINLK